MFWIRMLNQIAIKFFVAGPWATVRKTL